MDIQVSSSLSRLKKTNVKNETTVQSDDDKIRTQLLLDVKEFRSSIEALPVHLDPKLYCLDDVVESDV